VEAETAALRCRELASPLAMLDAGVKYRGVMQA